MSEPVEYVLIRYDRQPDAQTGINEWHSRGYEPAHVSAASSGPFSDFIIVLFRRSK